MPKFDERNRKTGSSHLLMESSKGLNAAAVCAKITDNQLSAQAASLEEIKDLGASSATEMYKNINAENVKDKIFNSAKAIAMTESTVKGLATASYSVATAIDAMKLPPAELKMPNIHRLIPNIPDLYDSLKRDKKGTALQLTSMEYKDFLLMLKEENWISPEYYELFYMSDKIRKRRLILAICKKKIKFQVRTDNENIIDDWPQEIDDDSKELVDRYLSNNSSNFLLLEGESFLSWLKENYPPDGEKFFPQEAEANSDSSPIANQVLSIPFEHEYESSLLNIAVECWKALYENAGPDGRKIRKPQIEKWLQENHAELSVNSRKTIAAIVNPFKSGGATPSL